MQDKDRCGRTRRDGRTGPSVTNPQDRRRRTSQSHTPKSDGEAEKPRHACRTRHEAKQNQQGPTPGSRKNQQTTEQGALEDTAEETSSAHVRRHEERPAHKRMCEHLAEIDLAQNTSPGEFFFVRRVLVEFGTGGAPSRFGKQMNSCASSCFACMGWLR